MLTITHSAKPSLRLLPKLGIGLVVVVALYAGSLFVAPALPSLNLQPLTPDALAQIKPQENRLIIPSLNLNISYTADESALTTGGALWRHHDTASPATGGNFTLAAQRLSVQATPGATIAQSPFYRLDKLKAGDKIIVDFGGKRYGYTVKQQVAAGTTLASLDAATSKPQLTLYSCSSTCEESGDRVGLIAEPLGEVRVEATK